MAIRSPRCSASGEVERFATFCEQFAGFTLAPFQRTIAAAILSGTREVVVILARGNGKSRLLASIGVWHLLTTPDAEAYIGASSADQASVIHRYAQSIARHAALASRIDERYRELRTAGGFLKVVSSDGARQHGATPTLCIADELWAWRNADLLDAFETSLIKRPPGDSQLVVISTAAASLDSPLGRIRTRALAQRSVTTTGAFIRATGPDLDLLEWSLAADADLDDMTAVELANPAPWIDAAALQRQREMLPAPVFAQFHASQFGSGAGAWLPPGAWQKCRAEYSVDEDEPLWLGVDIGGSRAASAVVALTKDLRVADVRVFQGDEAVLSVTEAVLDIAAHHSIVELAFDPWRYRSEALRLERDHGLTAVEFPQSHARMVPASEHLHKIIVEGTLQHPGHADLDRHVAAAVAIQTGRGWRLDMASRSAQIDAVIALAMSCERAAHEPEEPEPVELLGFL